MAKYVKCIDNSLYTGCITNGASYKVITQCFDTYSYLIVDDYKTERWIALDRFEEPYELPEAITFASQEEFEDAVMEVLLKRLGVQTLTFDKWGRKLTEQYSKSAVYDTLEKL